MVKLYGNRFSFNSNKVEFMANAIGVSYEFQSVDLAAGEQRKPDFLKVNPVGRIPALTDGSFMIFESNSICRYLAEKHNSPLYPKDLQKKAIVNQWLDFGSIHVGAAMGKIFFNTLVYKFVGETVDERSLQEGRKFLTNFLQILENQLKTNSYIAGGEITLADLNILAVLDPCEAVGFDLSGYPKLMAWRKNLQSQGFYKKVFSSYSDYLNTMMAQKA